MAFLKGAIFVSFACCLSLLVHYLPAARKQHSVIKLLPVIPAWFALCFKLKPGPFFDRAIVSALTCSYHCTFALLLSKISYSPNSKSYRLRIPFVFGILWMYSPLLLVFERNAFGLSYIDNERNDNQPLFYNYYMQFCWSRPFSYSMKLLSMFYGCMSFIGVIPRKSIIYYGVHTPSISIINDHICVGRLPHSNEISIIYDEPFNIRGVINMCIEDCGPISEYERFGIQCLHLPTIETLPPNIYDIEKAIAFINCFVEELDDGMKAGLNVGRQRILIHCRAGRARSAVIALCYLMSAGISITEGIQLLCEEREAINAKILSYDVVQYFLRKYQQQMLDGSRNEVENELELQPNRMKRLLSFHLF